MKKEILLSYFPKITHKRYQTLLKAFFSLDKAWETEFDDLKKIGWEDNLIHEFLLWKDEINEEKIEATLEKEKIRCITKADKEYPGLLKQIYDPPICLFVRGNLESLNSPIAIVGTRKHSQYAKQTTELIAGELAKQKVTIISGLAIGIDGIAHESALKNNTKTVAVLGSGIDKQHIYPANHKQLAEKIIAEDGAVISEYPPGTLPNKFTFPKRNRIIAGLSLATIVIEAPVKSGALITAQSALDNNREIFAVPHNIISKSGAGTNKLIKSGANIITSIEDIFEALDLKNTEDHDKSKKIIPDNPLEEKILNCLSLEPQHIDKITKLTELNSNKINSVLSLMEVKGKVKNIGNMTYILNN